MERSNYGYLLKEGQAICQIGLHLDPTPGRLQTSYHNGGSPREQSQKNRRLICMKGRGVSLGIDVSHRDRQIAALSGNLNYAHRQLHIGASSCRAQNTVIFVPKAEFSHQGTCEKNIWDGRFQ